MQSLKTILAAAMLSVVATSVVACPTDSRVLFVSCSTPVSTSFASLDGTPAPEGPENSLTITGTYSSGDRFGIEGIAIDAGTMISRRFQGWDGLAVITPEGNLSLHHVERVSLEGTTFNLRNAGERQAFEKKAGQRKLSAIQSHLLITDGKVDVRDQPGQPRFRRRILFMTRDGDIGVFDTGGQALTLFDAATALQEAAAPEMAFNLDMGSYDYCLWNRGGMKNCGRLNRDSTGILTNVLVFTFNP